MKYENISESLYIKGRIGWKGLKKGEYLKTGDYRIINGSNISNGVIDWSNCGYITKQRYFESPEIMLKKGDILITKDGTIGKVAIVNKLEYPSTIASGLFILRNNVPEKWNTLFLYYYLQTNRFKEFIHSRTEGSVIPHLYQKDFENLEIPYISLTEQYKISSKLDLIQRKISLNRQINDNLTFQNILLSNSFFRFLSILFSFSFLLISLNIASAELSKYLAFAFEGILTMWALSLVPDISLNVDPLASLIIKGVSFFNNSYINSGEYPLLGIIDLNP